MHHIACFSTRPAGPSARRLPALELLIAGMLVALSGCIESTHPKIATADASHSEPPVDSGPPEASADAARGDAQPDSGPQQPNYRLTREGMEVPATEAYTSCMEATDCTLVGNDCSCCGQTAVHETLKETWREQAQLACEDYQGPICDCAPLDMVALCEAGKCVAKRREEVDNCYSPFANTDRAYELGAVGCRCTDNGQNICIGGAALYCEEVTYGTGTLAWRSTVDGVCARSVDASCSDGALHDDAASCLKDSGTCYEMDDGRFCAL